MGISFFCLTSTLSQTMEKQYNFTGIHRKRAASLEREWQQFVRSWGLTSSNWNEIKARRNVKLLKIERWNCILLHRCMNFCTWRVTGHEAQSAAPDKRLELYLGLSENHMQCLRDKLSLFPSMKTMEDKLRIKNQTKKGHIGTAKKRVPLRRFFTVETYLSSFQCFQP